MHLAIKMEIKYTLMTNNGKAQNRWCVLQALHLFVHSTKLTTSFKGGKIRVGVWISLESVTGQ